MKIVVLAGGISTERDVSLVTGTSVCRALRENGHRAIFLDLFLGLEQVPADLESIFDAPDGLCPQVSISAAAPDLEAVRRSRPDQGPSRIGPHVLEICALADIVFLGLHGQDGEDGKQGFDRHGRSAFWTAAPSSMPRARSRPALRLQPSRPCCRTDGSPPIRALSRPVRTHGVRRSASHVGARDPPGVRGRMPRLRRRRPG